MVGKFIISFTAKSLITMVAVKVVPTMLFDWLSLKVVVGRGTDIAIS